MIGKRSDQISFNEIELWTGGCPVVDPNSIYGHLSKWGDRLIRDEDCESMYGGNGRPSISPALLSKVLLLMVKKNMPMSSLSGDYSTDDK